MARTSGSTRRSLLDAGRTEFSRKGLAGARTDQIAALAGVSKERIFAHFGSKEGLFEAVIADSLTNLLDVVPVPSGHHITPQGVIEYVAAVARYHQDHPDLMRLVLWESLESVDPIDFTSERAHIYAAKVDTFATALGVGHPQAATLLLQLILLAAGPPAAARLTALLMGCEPEQAIRETSAQTIAAAASLVAQAFHGPAAPGA